MEKICCVDKVVDNQLNLAVEFLKIIAEENRLKILCILLADGEKCVCDLWKYLNIQQNLTSHHLKVLKKFGLLNSRKDGLNVFYSINSENLMKYKNLLACFLTARKKCV